MKKQLIPSVYHRWCTGKTKLNTLKKYIKADTLGEDCIVNIGIGWYEKERISDEKPLLKNIKNRYLLADLNYKRSDCISLIKDFDLPVPVKSSCYICPYCDKAEWREFYSKHPDLVMKAVELEKNCKFKGMFFCRDKPLSSFLPLKTRKLLDFDTDF
jgi:hypothetical protein